MKPPPFAYHRPESLDAALGLLAEYGDDAKILAGGQSLLPTLSLRVAQPGHLIDISGLSELTSIRESDGGLALGSGVRHSVAERSAVVRERNPLMALALPLIGHPAIRNRGTIGGSLAHADPAAELPAVAVALDAEMVVRSTRGERTVTAEEFFVTFLTTALEPDEVLVEIRFPAIPAGAGWDFQEVSRRHGDFALVGVGSMIRLDQQGAIADARLAFTGVGGTPFRAHDAEQLLIGQQPTPEAFAAAADDAAGRLEPHADIHAPSEYRRHVANVLARRSLAAAAQRARSNG